MSRPYLVAFVSAALTAGVSCSLFKSKDSATPPPSDSASAAPRASESTNVASPPPHPMPRVGPGPGGTDASLPAPTPKPAASTGAAVVASAAPDTPPAALDLKSDCPDTIHVFLGEKPKSSAGTDFAVPGRATTSAPRQSDGSLTVWIVDGKGNGVTSAHASASTKRIVIGIDCRSIRGE